MIFFLFDNFHFPDIFNSSSAGNGNFVKINVSFVYFDNKALLAEYKIKRNIHLQISHVFTNQTKKFQKKIVPTKNY